jgi:hypothetical protein
MTAAGDIAAADNSQQRVVVSVALAEVSIQIDSGHGLFSFAKRLLFESPSS